MSQHHAEEENLVECTETLLHEQGYEHLRARKELLSNVVDPAPSAL